MTEDAEGVFRTTRVSSLASGEAAGSLREPLAQKIWTKKGRRLARKPRSLAAGEPLAPSALADACAYRIQTESQERSTALLLVLTATNTSFAASPPFD